MKKTLLITAGLAIAFAGILGFEPIATAQATELPVARNGTLFCGGNYNGDGTQRVTWGFRNYNDNRTITLDRIRLYKADGGVPVYDSDISGIPADRRGILAGINGNELAPHTSIHYRSEELAGTTAAPAGTFPILPGNVRPLQLVVDWSANRNAIGLHGGAVRREYDVNGVLLGRHSGRCRR